MYPGMSSEIIAIERTACMVVLDDHLAVRVPVLQGVDEPRELARVLMREHQIDEAAVALAFATWPHA